MSVQHESAGVGKATERTEAAPELEYRAVSQDSLSMFLAAIGGAVLGMLLTLLVLALINGGTLSYAGERITGLESHLQQVDENVGAVSANINIVSEQAAAIQQQLGAVETALRTEMETQSGDITALNESMVTLNQTREQFDIFVGALAGALTEMGAITAPPTEEGPAPGTTITETAPITGTLGITETALLTESVAPSPESTVLTSTAPITTTPPLTAVTDLTATGALTAATALTEAGVVTETTAVTE